MKLFLVTREDLNPGQQAVQAAHAMRLFTEEHPEVDRKWYTTSNTLAFLSVPNERALGVLLRKARDHRVAVSAFHEPYLGDALTALAIAPEGRRLVRNLPLALRASSVAA